MSRLQEEEAEGEAVTAVTAPLLLTLIPPLLPPVACAAAAA